MSEPVAKQRSYSSDYGDPLEELARLVGRDDPFKDLFPARTHAALPAVAESATVHPFRAPEPAVEPDFGFAPEEVHPAYEHGTQAEYSDTPHAGHEQAYYGEQHEHAHAGPAQEDYHVDEAHRLDLPRAYDDNFAVSTPTGEAPPVSADLWAERIAEGDRPGDAIMAPPQQAEADSGSRRRTLVVLASVMALTAGGLGATFLARGHSNNVPVAGNTPTIMADTDPVKVQPPETQNASTGGDGTTALIEKSASDNVANAKVVNAQEEPVDLAQLPKAPAATAPSTGQQTASASDNGSPFPTPRKVKTILIRPDGSVVGEAPAAPAAPALPTGAAGTIGMVLANSGVGANADAATPGDTAPVAKPATPKSTARASATPKAVAAASPVAKPAKPKPAEDADTTDTIPAPGPTGGYAVQLAAPPSEGEAKSLAARLQQKFAGELAGHRPSIIKGESGAKSVYRVRVTSLSQDDAKSLCSKLQASGGSCFVVHN